MAQIVARNPTYSDLDLNFLPNPTTKDVVILTGNDAIKRSIRNLMMTNYNDRLFNSKIGSNLTALLFENINPITATQIETAIRDCIRNFEPRVSVMSVDVSVDPDNNGYNVRLQYNIINQNQPVAINQHRKCSTKSKAFAKLTLLWANPGQPDAKRQPA